MTSTSSRQDPSVVIIGAGMTGIQLVIKLKQAGIKNIIVLEKTHDVGGTWRENTYPGICCDVPSHAYTYSFEPNPEWSSFFPSGSEIHAYFKKVTKKYEVEKHIRFNQLVTRCVYDEESNTWAISNADGEVLQADLLFSATGILHQPVIPDISGLDSFAGAKFHSSQWDHDADLISKRIGVIGTGSTATQIIPELVKLAGSKISVFQRTAQWIVKMDNRDFSDKEKQQFRDQPKRMERIRTWSARFWAQGTAALVSDRWFDRLTHKLVSWNGLRYLNKSIKDPELRAKLTPDYTFGCKRVVINPLFYDAIQQANVDLITENIDRIEPDGIVTKDGVLHPLDILVMATGFDATAFMRPMGFIGKSGVTIEQAWAKKFNAYRSMFLPDFPNFFLMLGPNSPIGNQSIIEISEIQTEYAIKLIDQWRAGKLQTIAAKPEAMQAWASMLKERMGHTVWTSGCQSWYLDSEGDALAWPDKWSKWVAAMQTPDLSDFVQN